MDLVWWTSSTARFIEHQLFLWRHLKVIFYQASVTKLRTLSLDYKLRLQACAKYLASLNLFANHSFDATKYVIMLMVIILIIYCKHLCNEPLCDGVISKQCFPFHASCFVFVLQHIASDHIFLYKKRMSALKFVP